MRCLRRNRITLSAHLYYIINVVVVDAEGAYYCFYPHHILIIEIVKPNTYIIYYTHDGAFKHTIIHVCTVDIKRLCKRIAYIEPTVAQLQG